jgi:hypothetical protein
MKWPLCPCDSCGAASSLKHSHASALAMRTESSLDGRLATQMCFTPRRTGLDPGLQVDHTAITGLSQGSGWPPDAD